MKLVKADRDTVTIEMTWQDEFEVIFNVFAVLHKNYDVADYMLHDVTLEEVNALYTALADIKARFKEGKNNQIPTVSTGLYVISANKEKLVLEISKGHDLRAIFWIINVLAGKYEISGLDTCDDLPGVTAAQIFGLEKKLRYIRAEEK